MRKQLTALIFVLVAVAGAVRLLEARPHPQPGPGQMAINGVWLGETREDVEAVWGEGNPVERSDRAYTYPRNMGENTVTVLYDRVGTVSGVKGYELRRDSSKFSVSGKLKELLEGFGDPTTVKVSRYKPGGSVEFVFADGLHVSTVLTRTDNHDYTLPDYIDSLWLGDVVPTSDGRSYTGQAMELRKRQVGDAEMTIYCGEIDILRGRH